jgi:hypothetical protein
MKPSDVLAGVPLSDSTLRILFIVESLARGAVEEDDIIDQFAGFEFDQARVSRASRALEHMQALYL